MMQFVSLLFSAAILSKSIIANPFPQSDFEISLPNKIGLGNVDVLDSQTVPTVNPDFSDDVSDSTCNIDLQPNQIVERDNEGLCHTRERDPLEFSGNRDNNFRDKTGLEEGTQINQDANTPSILPEEPNRCSRKAPFDIHVCCQGPIMGPDDIFFGQAVHTWVLNCDSRLCFLSRSSF